MDKEEARIKFGERLRTLREKEGLTVRKFGLMVGLSKDYIVDLEHGRKSPTLDTLIKIAAGFDISPAALLEGIGVPPGVPDLSDDSAGINYEVGKL